MEIDRRTFLSCASRLPIAALAAPLVAPARAEDGTEQLFAAARKSQSGRYSAAIFTAGGQDVRAIGLPGRGHDLAVCSRSQTCVVFARRPGNFAIAFRKDRSWAPVTFTTPETRHFYGHGVFSNDGRLLFATENDFEAGRGCIGIYDPAAGFRRIGEFDGHGIGPHDIALMERGTILVVANGGIETHPEIGGGRTKLNIATMSPSLVYLDAKTGDLIERHELPGHMRRLSLRHLDVGANRTVVIGGQLQSGAAADTPLILRHQIGSAPTAVDTTRSVLGDLRGYISSVAVDRAGEIAALTAARGGHVIFLDVASGQIVGSRQLSDVSGVSAARSGFVLTTGAGQIVTGTQSRVTQWQWDNHAITVTA